MATRTHARKDRRDRVGFDSATACAPGCSGAGSSFGAGKSGVETAGTVRTYSTIALTSEAVRFWKLRCTASAIGPKAEPRFFV